ncbi:MAG: hypothetical protein K9K68_00195 [Methylococcaceae bacterium]|jgi:hypothetical protein|nr:hypothetical protein [Methylococcaceae bacterium]
MTGDVDLNDCIPLLQLANEMGLNPSAFTRKLKRDGIPIHRDGPYQNSSKYLTNKDAEIIRERYRTKKIHKPETRVPKQSGVYAVVVPSYKGQLRLKVGWSDCLEDRLSTYRTLHPDLQVKRIWLCGGMHFERFALAVAENAATKVGPELFEGNIDRIVDQIDACFSAAGIKAQRVTSLP